MSIIVQMLSPTGLMLEKNVFTASSQVSLLEYRKRQREARRSGSKTECNSPVSTVPPLTMDTFPLETTSEPPPLPAPITLCSTTTTVKDSQTNEEAESAGEKDGEGQWYVLLVYIMTFLYAMVVLSIYCVQW